MTRRPERTIRVQRPNGNLQEVERSVGGVAREEEQESSEVQDKGLHLRFSRDDDAARHFYCGGHLKGNTEDVRPGWSG